MTKGIQRRDSTISNSRDKKDKLLEMMDEGKISLLQASQKLNIPYNTAKQILFIYSTPRKKSLIESMTPTSAKSAPERISPVLKDKVKSSKKKHSHKDNKRPAKNVSKPQAHYCEQCNCYCCPYPFAPHPIPQYVPAPMHQSHWKPYPYPPVNFPMNPMGTYRVAAPWQYLSVPSTYPSTPYGYYPYPTPLPVASKPMMTPE